MNDAIETLAWIVVIAFGGWHLCWACIWAWRAGSHAADRWEDKRVLKKIDRRIGDKMIEQEEDDIAQRFRKAQGL